jgi:hypothetical protein
MQNRSVRFVGPDAAHDAGEDEKRAFHGKQELPA